MGKKETKRIGPGRPPAGDEKRIKFSITLKPETLKILDKRRGKKSRSYFIEDLLNLSFTGFSRL